MSEKIVQLNEEIIKGRRKEFLRFAIKWRHKKMPVRKNHKKAFLGK